VRGDLPDFLALFSPDARSRHGGYEAIANDYRTFFADSSARAIDFHDLRLYDGDGVSIAVAQFVAHITPRTAFEAVEVHGQIQFDLRRDGDRVRIAKILHQER
jgi:hypothetical protein